MELTNFRLDRDADGIVVATWDMPGRSMNVFTAQAIEELSRIVEHVADDADAKGCVIASGKKDFSGGADLTMLQGLRDLYARTAREAGEEEAMRVYFEETRRLTLLFRRMETCGKPFVAAIHGVCLGGAFEMALACHQRIACDHEGTKVGLPEIKVGLFPGAGGTQRVARLMQTGDALQMMLKGSQIAAPMAKAMGLLHAVVPHERLIEEAKAWIREGGSPVAPWDRPDFRLPSGKVFSAAGMQIWPAANAIYRRETSDNYPAARALLQAVYEGLQLPMDLALKVESRHFARILRSKEAAAMIRSLFVSMRKLNKGARRPADVPPVDLRRIGIVGAGFMGAGIAFVAAKAGIDVVLVDRDAESAEKGAAQARKLAGDLVNKGRAKAAERDALVARITPTEDYAALAGCDLVIEAVFEDPEIKAEVIGRIEAAAGPDCVIGSNTSTLPISSLAQASSRPANVVGVHFFSPVDRMALVEVIKGRETGEQALATALDFVRAIRKTPIVVNDARGFFANRCVGAYLLEGHKMLVEGVPPAMIENAGKAAGMPVGPLALNDEVALDLALRIVKATKAQVGARAVDPDQEALLTKLVEGEGRLGRKNRKGFYDYPEDGKKRLWPGLAAIPAKRRPADGIDFESLRLRLLVAQALEAVRTVEEGVIVDPREADVGSILGFGFAPYSGGALSYVDFMGPERFIALARRFEIAHGPRFAPPALLVAMVQEGRRFYDAA
ncbi:MAG: 3-hydroxyacyl-CoA dehydrogenase [Salinarimonadaceae bacterium]|nr:MAG: 3-hydroxyacyl-CoA dehydrogenase [Salinarimonadaceae bacterium]